ncbi:hypothetical protein [Kitasatospora acidiphila]|nr:hypothetical protein [Kitasatospora acidiphila]
MNWIHSHAQAIGIAASAWMVFAAIVGIRVRRWRDRQAQDDR